MQDHALCRKFLLDRTGHIPSPFDFNPRPTGDRTGFVSRIARLHASEGGSVTNVTAGGGLGGNKPKTSPVGWQIVPFREAALVAAQYARH
jgi:hypothetical protein